MARRVPYRGVCDVGMGQLEQRFGDDEDANVRAVFLIAAVDYP